MKKILLFSVSFLLGVSLIVLIYHRIDLRDIFLRFKFLTLTQIAVLFLLTLTKISIWVVRWKIILKRMGFSRLRFRSLFSARLGEMSLSYLTPGMYYGGEVVRLFALKKNTQVPLSSGIVSIVLDRIIEITSFGLFAFLGALILIFRRSLVGAFFYTLLGLVTLILVFLIFRLLKSDKISKLIKFFHLDKIKFFGQTNDLNLTDRVTLIRGQTMDFFKNAPQAVFKGIILSLLGFITTVLQINFFIRFLGESSTFANAVLVRILTLFSGLIPIPATLGVYEGVSVLAFQNFHLTAETGLSFTLMTRLIDFSFVAAGLLIIIYYLTHHFFQMLNKNHRD